MADINEIIAKSAIDNLLKTDKALTELDTHTLKYVETLEKLNKELKAGGITIKQVQNVQKQAEKTQQEQAKLTKEQESAVKALENQRTRAYQQMLKQQQAEKEYEKTLKKQSKTIQDALIQNKALRNERNKVDTTTEQGIKKIKELNDQIDKNTNIIKQNTDSLSKQKIGIGGYKDGIIDAVKETKLFGVSINDASSLLKNGAGIIAGVTAVLVGLGKAYASSARGAEDLARASDRISIITKSLGNSLSDLSGGGNFFDSVLRGVQQTLLGVGSTIKSDLQVAILSTIRQLEILEVDQERAKKAQLDRAEQLRQIRDDERNSFIERKAANDALATVINEREKQTIEYQKEKLKGYQTLLNFDKGNIEIQTAIKQIEFEIADAREEAQGYRSEQQANDLALSKEYYANELELSNLKIQNEIEKASETLELRKKLIQNTLDLELKAAGDNQQLQDIARQKAKNETLKAEKEYADIKEKTNIDIFNKETQLQKDIQAIYDGDLEYFKKKEEEKRKEIQKTADKAIGVAFNNEPEQLPEESGFGDLGARLASIVEFSQKAIEENKSRLDIELEDIQLAYDNGIISYEQYEAAKSKIAEKAAEERMQIAQQTLGFINELGNIHFSQEQQRIQEQINNVEKQRAYELKLAGDNKNAQERINNKYNEQQRRLQKQQAENEKKQAIFTAIINTIRAVVSTLPNYVLAAITAAFGFAQVAAIESQPVPQFYTGTESAPDGLISVGERGRELIKTKEGKLLMANRPQLATGLKGAKIYNNQETEMIMKSTNSDGISLDISELRTEQQTTNKYLRNLGVYNGKGIEYPNKSEIKYKVR